MWMSSASLVAINIVKNVGGSFGHIIINFILNQNKREWARVYV